MILYPAIDIRGGRCVRLIEGDFNRETAFDTDPVDAARRWADAGAEWLHVVDLDGAVAGHSANLDAVRRIRRAVAMPIQLGGGLRSVAAIQTALDLGVNRVILGTAAVRDKDLVQAAVERWGDAIAIALDARDGKLAADGWLTQTAASAVDVAQSLAAIGVKHFILTDIRRDGTLVGPNLVGLAEVVDAVPAQVIASGGMSLLADVQAVAETGAAGAIIGRALYDGRIDLREALVLAATRNGR
ncbi:MAG: 1-(5-phosphoribosyl)-5-[(5-phosphoribosylamino)methylideneamino]imidazole-4-carboxamide isomerase [Thermomicrobiales bacterium]